MTWKTTFAKGQRWGHDSNALSGAKHRRRTADWWPSGVRPFLIILALDTTTRAGSVAVVRDGETLSETAGDPSLTHGQRLPSDLARARETAGVDLDDVGLLAVVAG